MKVRLLLAWFAVVVAVYGGIVALLGTPRLHRYQNDADANIAKAQRFLFSADGTTEENERAVLVGSSLSNRFPEIVFRKAFVNLAFSGSSALTGLELIDRAGRKPQRVLIEANVVLRDVDRSLVDDADGFLPQHMSVFRVDMKPINLVLSYLFSIKFDEQAYYQRDLAKSSNPGTHAIALEAQRQEMSRLADPALLRTRLDQLQRYIEPIGDKAVLFEMPVDAQLVTTPHAQQIRREVRARFPKVAYIDLNQAFPEGHGPDTMDGVHLVTSDAVRAGRLLCQTTELKDCP